MTEIDAKECWEAQYPDPLPNNLAQQIFKRRDWVDVIRTAYWVLVIKHASGVTVLFQLERRFEPEAFQVSEHGVSYHWSKWSQYSRGRHVPSSALVGRVQLELPGTAEALNHVLWLMLRAGVDIGARIPEWLARLGPEISAIAYRTRKAGRGTRRERLACSGRMLKMIERRASLDALVLLIILLIESEQNKQADSKRAEQLWTDIVRSLWRVLLIVCSMPPLAPICSHVYAIFAERIFPLIGNGKYELAGVTVDFVEACYILQLANRQYDRRPKAGQVTPQKRVNNLLFLLEGGAGFDVKFALTPPIAPSAPRSDVTAQLYKDYFQREKWRAWGRGTILTGRNEIFPPG